jgi:hypothetical protein
MKVLVLALFALIAGSGDDPQSNIARDPRLAVEFVNERLSVQADGVTLKLLLDEIGEKSGIRIDLRDEQAAARPISVELQNLPPASALDEILSGLNFAFYYSGPRLARVIILPQGAPAFKGAPGAAIANRLRGGRAGAGAGSMPPKPRAAPLKPAPQTAEESRIAAKLEAIDKLEESNDPKSVGALADMFSDPSREVKEAALQALADKQGNSVTQLIRRGLNDRDAEFRIEVLEVLADRGDLDSLRKAKSDPNEDVRERAADLLESSKR